MHCIQRHFHSTNLLCYVFIYLIAVTFTITGLTTDGDEDKISDDENETKETKVNVEEDNDKEDTKEEKDDKKSPSKKKVAPRNVEGLTQIHYSSPYTMLYITPA